MYCHLPEGARLSVVELVPGCPGHLSYEDVGEVTRQQADSGKPWSRSLVHRNECVRQRDDTKPQGIIGAPARAWQITNVKTIATHQAVDAYCAGTERSGNSKGVAAGSVDGRHAVNSTQLGTRRWLKSHSEVGLPREKPL
jgi:hypothetical protein